MNEFVKRMNIRLRKIDKTITAIKIDRLWNKWIFATTNFPKNAKRTKTETLNYFECSKAINQTKQKNIRAETERKVDEKCTWKCNTHSRKHTRTLTHIHTHTRASSRSGIPSGVSRNCRMVALCGMSRKIARSRLRGFNIRSNVHRNPRAAKPSPLKL